MTVWTRQQVLDAAPDAASMKAAVSLATPAPWSQTGSTEALVWGRCQGSGGSPYQVSVDLHGPAYRCSCPSRKVPCKHALALLLLWSQGSLGGDAPIPEQAADPAATQATRSAPSAPPDPEAQARREQQRLATMDAGVTDGNARRLTAGPCRRTAPGTRGRACARSRRHGAA